ncbi:MAG: U32 family peptidase, partial [Bacteroidota bacterium]|nr:U32 family peptidase [Bacteroidota bacterium]
CREHEIKSYLTLNIIIYDKDIQQMKDVVDRAKASGISAIIASDIAVINYAREQDVEIHISTQANVCNIEAVKFYSRFADVMVLARELNLDQVCRIHEAIEKEGIKGPSGNLVRIEMFVHGALCQAVSGKCYLSLHEKNYSANRGKCLQTCRKAYIVTDKETGYELEIDNEYIMSPKDLCTIHFLNKMVDAGVRVMKVEGRARGPEYVKTTVCCYHDALNSIADGTYTPEKIEKWKQELSTVFNRGFWDGYYLGQKLGEWSNVYGSKATKRKVYLGKGTNYFSKLKVAEFYMETGTLKNGDEILIIGPTTGVIQTTVKEIRVDLENVNEVSKGKSFSIPLDSLVRRSDKLYKLVDSRKVTLQ